MKTNRWGNVGPVLLIFGGLVEAGAYGLALISASMNTLLGAIFLIVDVGAWGFIGVGLIASGLSLVGRGRTALKIAGVLALIVGIVEAVQNAFGTSLGPLPGFYTVLAYVAAVAGAGVRLLSDRTVRGGARWSIAVPAICFLFYISGGYIPLFAPVLSLPGMILVPWIGMIVGGVLLLRYKQRSSGIVTHLIHT